LLLKEEADRQNVVVGHYTNLFWAANQVMGVGYTRYRWTSCYNASDASNYTDDRYNTAMHLYTVNDFEQLVKNYYQTVDKASCEEKLNTAIEEHSAAETSLKTLQDSKNSRIEEATQKARAELAIRQEDEEKAAQRLKAAKEVLDAARTALQDAGAKKISAGQILQDAKSVLDQAAERSRTADTNLAYAVSSRDAARQKKADAENALKDAAEGKTSAEAALEEKKTVLSNAQAVFEQLADAYTAATQRLNELTSEKTIASLKEKKEAAETALQAALGKQSQKEGTLEKAHVALKQADAEALEAADALKAIEAQLADALVTRNAAKEKAAAAEEALSALRVQYAPVQHAFDVRDAARENLNIAEAALKDAREELASAQAKLTQAQQTKAGTEDRLERASGLSLEEALKADIEDPDFAWLNEYVSAVKTADQELADARMNLGTAISRLDARKADSEKAQKAYHAALADLVLAQNRAGALQVKQGAGTVQRTGQKADQKAAVQTKGGKKAVVMEMKTRTKAAAGSDNKNETVWAAPTEPVATGDNTNLMGLLVKLFASIGVFAAVWKARKGVDEKKKPSGQKG
jgi:chromosome segregation ATPase